MKGVRAVAAYHPSAFHSNICTANPSILRQVFFSTLEKSRGVLFFLTPTEQFMRFRNMRAAFDSEDCQSTQALRSDKTNPVFFV